MKFSPPEIFIPPDPPPPPIDWATIPGDFLPSVFNAAVPLLAADTLETTLPASPPPPPAPPIPTDAVPPDPLVRLRAPEIAIPPSPPPPPTLCTLIAPDSSPLVVTDPVKIEVTVDALLASPPKPPMPTTSDPAAVLDPATLPVIFIPPFPPPPPIL